MRRVLIIGCGGAGKSHFAVELGRAIDLPVIHLDCLYWKPGWQETPKDQWTKVVERAAAADAWIMDGNFKGTLAHRLTRADTVIFLDLPRTVCLLRVAKRWLIARWQQRVGMIEGCPERWDWDFIKWIWGFERSTRPLIMEMLGEVNYGKTIHIARSAAAARSLLRDLTGGAP